MITLLCSVVLCYDYYYHYLNAVQQIIYKLRDKNLAILITDHTVRETLACVDRAYLMAMGSILCEGDRNFLINDPEAIKVYLGPNFV